VERWAWGKGRAWLRLERLVDQQGGLVLVAVAGEHQLGHEDLAGPLEHALLAGRQALLAVADGEVADDLGDLEDVAGLEALDVALEAAAPVPLGRGLPVAQDLEDAVDVVGAADLADADLLAVVARGTMRVRSPYVSLRTRYSLVSPPTSRSWRPSITAAPCCG
jgi:hypothetical protein